MILITDPRWSFARIADVIAIATSALPAGELVVQLRDKAATADDLAKTASRLRAVTTVAGALLIVNVATPDALAVAADAGADGAHVPCRAEDIVAARARLGPAAWISTPAHADEDATIADAAGATAVLVSPIFASPGKGPARGVAAIVSARARSARLRLVALGGVDASNAAACAEAGADDVAVIRALLDAPDVAAAARALHAPFIARGRAASHVT